MLAHLLALKAGLNAKLGLQYQIKLVKSLLHLGYTKENVKDLYQFIDYRFNLPDNLSKEFFRDVQQYEQEVDMQQQYMSYIERVGLAEGLAIGEVKGEVRLLMRQLRAKFKRIPKSYMAKIDSADANTLEQWGENILFADTLSDVFKD